MPSAITGFTSRDHDRYQSIATYFRIWTTNSRSREQMHEIIRHWHWQRSNSDHSNRSQFHCRKPLLWDEIVSVLINYYCDAGRDLNENGVDDTNRNQVNGEIWRNDAIVTWMGESANFIKSKQHFQAEWLIRRVVWLILYLIVPLTGSELLTFYRFDF